MDFNDDFAAECSDTIAQDNDMKQERERIRKRQDIGCTIKERLAKFQNFASGNTMKTGTDRPGKDALELMKERRRQKERLKKEKIEKLRLEWQQSLDNYLSFRLSNKPIDRWIENDYILVLNVLKNRRRRRFQQKV